MHEYSIVAALVDTASGHTAARRGARIVKLWVSIGELSGVEPELLATAYDTFRAKTSCERAALEIRRVAAAWACPRCGAPFARGERLFCQACQCPVKLVRGDEIVLDRIEMEVSDV